jgi:hypothetical protein
MSRASTVRTNAPSRIRLVVFEAELSSGNVTEVTQVIQNALRANNPQTASLRAIAQRMATSNVVDQEQVPVEEIVGEPTEGIHETVTPPRPAVPRKFRTPKVIDVDLVSNPSFESYAKEKNPISDLKKFLVVAAWFQEHRKLDLITVDHVYTCYRKVAWSTDIGDFSQPLRELKRRQLLDKESKGNYSINHLGLSEVDKLGS